MYRKRFFQTFKNIAIVMIFFWLREQGYVNNWGFVIGALATIILVAVLTQRFTVKRTMKNLDDLKAMTPLLKTDPQSYFDQLDGLIQSSNGYEHDYLILHKANTLAKINKADQAIKVLEAYHPKYLDTANLGVYYNNLLGLLVQTKETKKARAIYNEYKDILEANYSSSFAYSIYTNIANLKYQEGHKAQAQEFLDKAMAATDDEKIRENIKKLKAQMD